MLTLKRPGRVRQKKPTKRYIQWEKGLEWHWLGSGFWCIPVKDPPRLPLKLPWTLPSHQNSSLALQLSTEHRYHPLQRLWSKLLAPLLTVPGRNSNVNCQGHNIYSCSHPCLPLAYLYQNILSPHCIIECMHLTLATPVYWFFLCTENRRCFIAPT